MLYFFTKMWYYNRALKTNAVYIYSSGDRAMPSGGMCGGSNPPRCVIWL